MRNYKAPLRHCKCGNTWTAKNGGQGRRTRCSDCYPVYRKAVNLYAACKHRATKNKYPFDLTVEWIEDKIKAGCPKTGNRFDFRTTPGYKDRYPNSPSVDKINPDGGYTQENCQVVSWLYNCAKQRFSEEDVYNFCLSVINLKNTQLATNADQVTA